MNIIPENYSSKHDDILEMDIEDHDDAKEYWVPKKKRKTYTAGGTTARKGKLTSVTRLLLVCIVPEIKET